MAMQHSSAHLVCAPLLSVGLHVLEVGPEKRPRLAATRRRAAGAAAGYLLLLTVGRCPAQAAAAIHVGRGGTRLHGR